MAMLAWGWVWNELVAILRQLVNTRRKHVWPLLSSGQHMYEMNYFENRQLPNCGEFCFRRAAKIARKLTCLFRGWRLRRPPGMYRRWPGTSAEPWFKTYADRNRIHVRSCKKSCLVRAKTAPHHCLRCESDGRVPTHG